MANAHHYELPDDKKPMLRKAKMWEWITLAYLVSTVILMYLVLGSSKAMRAAWLEDLFSLIPPIMFFIGNWGRAKAPSKRFPYGHHRTMMIAYAVASMALLGMGLYLIYNSSMSLYKMEHPTLGTFRFWGMIEDPIWIGWVMLPVLFYSGAPAVLIGYMKQKPGRQLHDKPVFADAAMNKADWMTAAAAVVGVLLVGFGFWWADSVAALVIALDVTNDGVRNTWSGFDGLMDRAPKTVDQKKFEDTPQRVAEALKTLDWVEDAEVRLREAGQVFFGEAFIKPVDETEPSARVEEALKTAYAVDWRVHDLTVQISRNMSEVSRDVAIATD